MNKQSPTVLRNLRLARLMWGKLAQTATNGLRELTEKHRLSIAAGDLLLLEGRWYVTHAGLLHLATRNRCSGIRTQLLQEFSDPATGRWVFKATVYQSSKSKGFVGFGDADPSNVSAQVHGAEMRIAETRAVNRALRKAYGIGLCSVEELGSLPGPGKSSISLDRIRSQTERVASGNGRSPLRDRLCQLIRQHNLDPTLVKRYAAQFCETDNLREAGRERIEAFVQHLAEQAAHDRAGLLCQLNSLAQSQEARS